MCGGEGYVASPPYSVNLPMVPFLSAFCTMITNQQLINNRDFLGDVPSLVFHSISPHRKRFLCVPGDFRFLNRHTPYLKWKKWIISFTMGKIKPRLGGVGGGNAFLYSVDPIDSRGGLESSCPNSPPDLSPPHHSEFRRHLYNSSSWGLTSASPKPTAGPIVTVVLAEPTVIGAVRFSTSDK